MLTVIYGGMEIYMKPKIIINPDKDVEKRIREGLRKKGGYCPCKLEITDDNKCICKEFREQIADPDYEGYCHCMLYYKTYEKEGE